MPDASPLAKLYQTHREPLLRAAMRLGASRVDAEDLVQATFVVAHERLPQFRGDAQLSTWVYGILINLRRNDRRRDQRAAVALSTVAPRPAATGPEQLFVTYLVMELLAELDLDHRAMVLLKHGAGMTHAEVARTLDINPNTAYSRLRTIDDRLRARAEDPVRESL